MFFNRDEVHSRRPGAAPRVSLPAGGQTCKVLAPLDPGASGTWIGVNERGLIVALLNYYGFGSKSVRQTRSRGKLVKDLLSSQSDAPQCMRELERIDMSQYPGFFIFFMDLKNLPQAMQWDGHALSDLPLDPATPCLSTSSVRPETCVAYRRKLFEGVHAPDLLRQAHLHYNTGDSALGPLMLRADAATDCLTEILLTSEQADMKFQSVSGMPPVVGESINHSLLFQKEL